ncbi:hypothetical protein [Anabaena lutea]|uniref:Mor transcription activator domain-containing protein n=1 Tax=Anabaena lutea FACHB-196 TaxID=2692881 RepID=A0ABR8FJS9_9NOST|nr:hypothetical protein [Anabaena lutea]MBD2570036.1 hypothetical protein [Anabaena lutea FACHB-196]
MISAELNEYIPLLQSDDIEGCKSRILKEICREISISCVIGLIEIANLKRDSGIAISDGAVDIYVPQNPAPSHLISKYCGLRAMQKLCDLYAGLYIRVYSVRSALIRCRNRYIRKFCVENPNSIHQVAETFGLDTYWIQKKILLTNNQ